jgi:hypothetical protein
MISISDSTYKGLVSLLNRVIRDMPTPYLNRNQGETIRRTRVLLRKLNKYEQTNNRG